MPQRETDVETGLPFPRPAAHLFGSGSGTL